MYLPPAFSAKDITAWHKLIADYPLANVIAIPHIEISNIPLLLEHEGDKSYLRGHIARANPLYNILSQDNPYLLCIFNGPHGYISPGYYLDTTAPGFNVPTWNYAVVHISGHAKLVDSNQLIKILDNSITKFESQRQYPWTIDWQNMLARKKLDGIIGFEVEISYMQGKFKLSQNRTATDQTSVIAGLNASSNHNDQVLAEFMRHSNGTE